MNLTSLAIHHQYYAHEGYEKQCFFRSFGVKTNKLWVEHVTWVPAKKEFLPVVAVEYDLSNIITGITYRHSEQSATTLIESMVTHDGKHLDIVLFPTHSDFYAAHFDSITETYQHKHAELGVPHTPKSVADHTIIFPTVETNAEWKDRMQRLLADAAHNFEAAIGSIYSKFYTRSLDASSATARRSTDYLNREANTNVHCRTQIGWLWKQVTTTAHNFTSRASVEADVLALHSNMATPQAVKMFFHHHDITEWAKLRYSTGDNRSHRRVHLWNADYSAGKLLRDVDVAHSGENAELDKKAEFHILATSEYKKAASAENYEPITERVYE